MTYSEIKPLLDKLTADFKELDRRVDGQLKYEQMEEMLMLITDSIDSIELIDSEAQRIFP